MAAKKNPPVHPGDRKHDTYQAGNQRGEQDTQIHSSTPNIGADYK